MYRPPRLLLDWIIVLVTEPGRFAADQEQDMEEFGLIEQQRRILLHKDPTLIRQWIEYELSYYTYGGTMHIVCMVMHGVPPPPPPPPPPGT